MTTPHPTSTHATTGILCAWRGIVAMDGQAIRGTCPNLTFGG